MIPTLFRRTLITVCRPANGRSGPLRYELMRPGPGLGRRDKGETDGTAVVVGVFPGAKEEGMGRISHQSGLGMRLSPREETTAECSDGVEPWRTGRLTRTEDEAEWEELGDGKRMRGRAESGNGEDMLWQGMIGMIEGDAWGAMGGWMGQGAGRAAGSVARLPGQEDKFGEA
ncbi:hypothetical protein AXG93_517s1370 [Marchantia polymorpha subsp. ruderalis]|uniref:Uncharacterized protein n=1 Tax=Marchantia polymorpha subsp. ruderalis TaxID=1480154 RepID=A0A176VJU4_MARPO|nr:hypothetical protein AXG93_517s1370 [Marchantia polymorpha subsp. ruderalis]